MAIVEYYTNCVFVRGGLGKSKRWDRMEKLNDNSLQCLLIKGPKLVLINYNPHLGKNNTVAADAHV